MRIGELSTRTGVATRLLRYYEEQRLLVPTRDDIGYRIYGLAELDRVEQIRGLIESGIPTRIIRDLLPCLNGPRQIHLDELTPEMLSSLEHQRERMEVRIACLTRNREAIDTYLNVVRKAHPSSASLGENRGSGVQETLDLRGETDNSR